MKWAIRWLLPIYCKLKVTRNRSAISLQNIVSTCPLIFPTLIISIIWVRVLFLNPLCLIKLLLCTHWVFLLISVLQLIYFPLGILGHFVLWAIQLLHSGRNKFIFFQSPLAITQQSRVFAYQLIFQPFPVSIIWVRVLLCPFLCLIRLLLFLHLDALWIFTLALI